MPRNTTTLQLGDALDDLNNRLDELAERTVDETRDTADDQREDIEATMQHAGGTVERYRDGVSWAVDEYGADATVTIGGLTTGEYGRVEDRAADASREKGGGSTEGIVRVFQIAAGLEDAPFVDAGAGFEERAAAVRELPPQLAEWLQSKVNEQGSLGGNGKSFSSLLAEKQAGETSTDEASSSSPESS